MIQTLFHSSHCRKSACRRRFSGIILLIAAMAVLSSCGRGASGARLSGFTQTECPLQKEGLVLRLSGIPTGSEEDVTQAVRELSYENLKTSKIYLQNPGFIDAEKTGLTIKHDNSYQCWAACASNMLWVTGWGAGRVNPATGKNFASEDEIFRYYTARFSNEPGDIREALAWFLNRECRDGLISVYNVRNDRGLFSELLNGIKDGDALSIAVEFRQRISGCAYDRHSLTVFGFVENTQTGEPEFIVAADSGDSCAADASNADDRYRFIHLRNRTIDGIELLTAEHYGDASSDAVITTVFVLRNRSEY